GEERARIPLQAPPDQPQQAEAGDESGADDARLVLPAVHRRTGTQAGDDRQHDGEEQQHGEVAPQRRAGRAVLEPDLDQDGESDRAAGRHAGQAPFPAALDEERRERGEQDDKDPRRSRRRHPHHQDEGVEPEAESRRDPRDLISLAVLFQPLRREPGRQPRRRVEQRREADRRERRPPERGTRALSRPERQGETRGQGAADQQEAAAAEQRDGDERRVEQREIAEEQRPLAGVGLVPAQEESQDERHGGSRGGALQQRRRLLLLREHRQEEVEQTEEQEDGQADDLLLRRQELVRPADLDEESAQQTQYHEPMPALPHGDGHETEVEQQDVGEEAQGPVLAGRQQDRRGEAAEEAQDRAEDRVVADGDDAGHDGDQGHHQERHPERQEVPERVRRVEGGIEDGDRRARDRVGGGDVAAAQADLGPDEPADAGEDHRGGAQRGAEEAGLIGHLGEEDAGDDERDAPQPRGALEAEQALPVEPRLGGRRRSRHPRRRDRQLRSDPRRHGAWRYQDGRRCRRWSRDGDRRRRNLRRSLDRRRHGDGGDLLHAGL